MRWITSSLTVALSLTGPAVSVLTPRARIEVEHNTRIPALDGLHKTASQPVGRLNTTISLHHFDTRQTAGRCGADFGGQRCGNNQCCSSYGYCGTDPEHCALLVGCQPDYGRCGDAPEPTPTPTPTPTPAPPSSPPVISSSSTIVPTTSSVLPPLPSGTLIVSPNGQCGNVTTCAGSTFGRCCSEYYYCGNSPAFCGTGCRPGFGACDGGLPPIVSSSVPVPIPPTSSVISSSSLSLSTTSINIPTPTSTPTPSSTAAPVPTNVSTNGRCGPEGNGMTCQGSSFGRCCSDYGWCGNLSPDFCSVAWGCRPQFGSCG